MNHWRVKSFVTQKTPHLLECSQLVVDRRRIHDFGRGQVGGKTFQQQVWRRLQGGADLVPLGNNRASVDGKLNLLSSAGMRR